MAELLNSELIKLPGCCHPAEEARGGVPGSGHVLEAPVKPVLVSPGQRRGATPAGTSCRLLCGSIVATPSRGREATQAIFTSIWGIASLQSTLPQC